MATTTGIEVVPATGGRWPDVEQVFGVRGDPSWCWCQYFLTTGGAYETSAARNKAALQTQLDEPPVQRGDDLAGLLAYRDGEPVGWLQLGPRDRFPRVTGNRAASAVVAGESAAVVWRVTCIVVRVGHRRRGVGGALLGAAVEHASSYGAEVLEGHPVDVPARNGRVGSAELYHGTLSMFLRAGFVEVGRTGPSRPVVRKSLGHTGSRPEAPVGRPGR